MNVMENRNGIKEGRSACRKGSQRRCSKKVTLSRDRKDDGNQLWRGDGREPQAYRPVSARL